MKMKIQHNKNLWDSIVTLLREVYSTKYLHRKLKRFYINNSAILKDIGQIKANNTCITIFQRNETNRMNGYLFIRVTYRPQSDYINNDYFLLESPRIQQLSG